MKEALTIEQFRVLIMNDIHVGYHDGVRAYIAIVPEFPNKEVEAFGSTLEEAAEQAELMLLDAYERYYEERIPLPCKPETQAYIEKVLKGEHNETNN